MKRVVFTLVLILLALAAGVWLGAGRRKPASYVSERAALSIQFARTLLPYKVLFLVLFGGVILVTLGGLGCGAVRWINRRADTVYPDPSGLYPLREGRVGRAKVFHDPNRTLTGTTVYSSGGHPITIRHTLPGGHPGLQQQVTGQAQAAQALRAAVSGPAPLPSAQGLPAQLLECQLSRPLPEVQELGYEPSHIERLLLQDGDPAKIG